VKAEPTARPVVGLNLCRAPKWHVSSDMYHARRYGVSGATGCNVAMWVVLQYAVLQC
jgi:hypothetical protein